MIIMRNILVGLILVIAVALGAALWIFRDIPADIIEAKYVAPNSLFIDIDGVRFHYRDEGEGPAVLLLHAHWGSLIMWDKWAEALKDSYRVVRLDLPGQGLTGPDPTGEYSMPRYVSLLKKFADTLGIDQMYLVGTSLGGTMTIRFADAHPDMVKHLIIMNPGALNARTRGLTEPPDVPLFFTAIRYFTPRSVFSGLLSSSYADPDGAPDSVVDRWYDMQMRDGNRQAALMRQQQYIAGDIEATIASLTVPTLILWGEANTIVPVEQAYEIEAMLTLSETTLITYPGIGHLPALEAPDETARDVRAYLDAAEAGAD